MRRSGPACRSNFDRFPYALAKFKLDIAPEPELTLIGISSHVNDYRLCWALNRHLGITLQRRRNDIEEEGPEARMGHYAVFDHLDEEEQVHWTLVQNHCGDGVLLKEQHRADFFLMVDEPGVGGDLLDRVRTTEFVLTAFPLDMRDLKGGYKLLQ